MKVKINKQTTNKIKSNKYWAYPRLVGTKTDGVHEVLGAFQRRLLPLYKLYMYACIYIYVYIL